MAELVDAQDLKSCEGHTSCRFKSGLRHHLCWRDTQVWLKGPVLKTGRSGNWRKGSNPFLSAIIFIFINIAEWSSLVARRAHNPKATSSNLVSATIWSRGVAVITSACHAEDREFDSRRDRHFFWLHSSVGRARD